jgi:hypothetical protein
MYKIIGVGGTLSPNFKFFREHRNRFCLRSLADRARICKPFKEHRNRFPAGRAGTKTLFVVPVRQATETGGNNYSESIPGLLKRLQIRAQPYLSYRPAMQAT